ncbi:MAG TPA: hypothetical protein VFC24_11955 [Casimicrobiaceae bacterium]|nr:hypothetical protein [Casimicrobiaceae bacterium]
MAALLNGGFARRQRGWAGMAMLLVALLVVGWLARSALKQMGLVDGAPSAIVTGKVQAAPVASPAAVDAASPSAAAPLDRARAVQAQVLQQGAAAQEQLNKLER